MCLNELHYAPRLDFRRLLPQIGLGDGVCQDEEICTAFEFKYSQCDCSHVRRNQTDVDWASSFLH